MMPASILIFPNLIRAIIIFLLCVFIPYGFNPSRDIKHLPADISLFSYGFACCSFIDLEFAYQAGKTLYQHYPIETIQVPCSILIVAMAFLQLLVYSIIKNKKFQESLISTAIWVKIEHIFYASLLAFSSLFILLGSELFWR